jgi:cytochrome c oxidase assembly protein subunit 15
LWRFETRRWVQLFGLLLLVGVIAQGILGGLRVRMGEEALAMLHGCVGPVFFGLCAAMCVVTSRRWRAAVRSSSGDWKQPPRPLDTATTMTAKRLMVLAAVTAFVAYLQLVVGAQLRHLPATAEPDVFRSAVHIHLALAAVVLLHAGWLALALGRMRLDNWLIRPAQWLVGLVVLQLCLGASTWFVKYGSPPWVRQAIGEWDFAVPAASRLQSVIVTAHVATGSLIVAVATVACLRIARFERHWPVTYVGCRAGVEPPMEARAV